MRQRRFPKSLGAVGFAVLVLAGCGGGSPAPPAPPRSSDTAPASATVTAYSGPALPGLAAKPVARLDGINSTPIALGNSFVVVETRLSDEDRDRSSSGPARVTFYDAATGRKRATAEVPFYDIKKPEVSDFNGTPAVFLHGVEVKPSDGLSAKTTVEHEVGFDESGRKLVDSTWNEADGRVAAAGWTMTVTKGNLTRPGLTVYGPDGTARLTLPSDKGDFGEIQPTVRAIIKGIALIERARSTGSGTQRYLAAYDLSKPGDPVWTSDSARPTGATGSNPGIAFTSGSVVGLVWSAGSGRAVVAVQDLRTGAVKGTTPAIDEHPGIGENARISEADNAKSGAAVLAVGHASTNVGSVAVSLADGHLLWQQTPDQAGFDPMVVVGGTVYGSSTSSPPVRKNGNEYRPSLAVSVTNGQVLAKELSTAPVEATDSGYAIVPDSETRGSYWIFTPAAS